MRLTHVIENLLSHMFLKFSDIHYSGLAWVNSIDRAQRFTDHDDAQAFLNDIRSILGNVIMDLDIIDIRDC